MATKISTPTRLDINLLKQDVDKIPVEQLRAELRVAFPLLVQNSDDLKWLKKSECRTIVAKLRAKMGTASSLKSAVKDEETFKQMMDLKTVPPIVSQPVQIDLVQPNTVDTSLAFIKMQLELEEKRRQAESEKEEKRLKLESEKEEKRLKFESEKEERRVVEAAKIRAEERAERLQEENDERAERKQEME
jgi:hypothetical protein